MRLKKTPGLIPTLYSDLYWFNCSLPHEVAGDHRYDCYTISITPPWKRNLKPPLAITLDIHWDCTVAKRAAAALENRVYVGYIHNLEIQVLRNSVFSVQPWGFDGTMNTSGFTVFSFFVFVTGLLRNYLTPFPRRWTKAPWWEISQKIWIWKCKS